MSTILDEIRTSIRAQSPVIYLYSPEEERLLRMIRTIADEQGAEVREWTCVEGLEGTDDIATRDPVTALQRVIDEDLSGFIVFKDLAPFLDRPEAVRAVRDVYYSAAAGHRTLIILSADLNLPETLKKEVHMIEVPPPEADEILRQLTAIRDGNSKYDLADEALQEVTMALKGLTETEIRHVMHRVLQQESANKDELIDEIFNEKKNIVKKSGYLEFSPPRWGIEGLGGLDNLKDWLTKRRHMFTPDAVAAGVPVPKGLLMMGISGCGKSLAVKVISSLWQIPLFRLDMNLVFSGMYGSPEETFHRALRTVEAVAPAVLWIDEIENALGMDDEGMSLNSHIFSSFLTWMQEKPPMVFIAATANRIQALPAEIIRKGRFDQVFFCDLPTKEERDEIFRIHLARNGADLDEFDFKMLTVQTEGWNGAEIEQAVISARTEAYYEGREFGQRELDISLAKIVPLSETMEQQIKNIRSWAFSRATPASAYGRRRR
jgi:ATP-dependent 26S proteasome regulatory subunit